MKQNKHTNEAGKDKQLFGAPEGYFDVFADNLSARIEREELAKEAPLLFSVPKMELFAAPDGYFDTLHVKVRERISTIPKFSLSVLFENFRFRVAFASVLVFVAATYFFLNGNNSSEDVQLSDLSSTELQSYVENEITQGLNTSDLDDYFVSSEEFTAQVVDAESDEIETWVVEQMDLNEIIDEL